MVGLADKTIDRKLNMGPFSVNNCLLRRFGQGNPRYPGRQLDDRDGGRQAGN